MTTSDQQDSGPYEPGQRDQRDRRGQQDEADVRAAYDAVADTYADHFGVVVPELPPELGMLEHFASLLPGERVVLDAGCGAGRMMPRLAALGCRVEGVDLSPGMIRRARQDHAAFRSCVASLTDLPFPDASFDGVFSWYSTIHSPAPDLPRIMAEARRAREGGLFLAAFQSGHGVYDVSDAYRRRGHDITLRRHNRTPDEVAGAMTAAGLTEVARLERRAAPHERSAQAVLMAQA